MKTTKERAYEIGREWLSNPDWIDAHLRQLTPAQFRAVSEALSKCFQAVGDEAMPIRDFHVALQVEIGHLHAVLIETVLWPQLVHKAEQEQMSVLGAIASKACDYEPIREAA